jgi:hypothetical protein
VFVAAPAAAWLTSARVFGASIAHARDELNRRAVLKLKTILAVAVAAAFLTSEAANAQSRVGPDSTTRLRRLAHDLAYGTVEGIGFAAIDQARDNPEEWDRGWGGYGKRVASNVGEFYIQEVVTEGLAAAMNRPLDYIACKCRGTIDRTAWAVRGALFDQMPRGRNALAVPRIVGAYAGSFAQASWRPTDGNRRARIALVNGATSLGIGAVINLYHEFAPWSSGNRCRRSESSRCAPSR